MANYDKDYVLNYILNCRNESLEAKRSRMDLNRQNYDTYMLKHDFSHKEEGQSTEVLAKQRMAVEQIKSFFQQSLADLGEWWRCVPSNDSDGTSMLLRPEEVQKLTNRMLSRANFFSHVGNNVQAAVLGSLAITELGGKMCPKPKYMVEKKGKGKSYKKTLKKIEDKTWELDIRRIRAEDYYPDPTGAHLYEIDDRYVDYHTALAMAEGDYPIYDKAALAKVSPLFGTDEDLQQNKKANEVGQDMPTGQFRPKIKLTTFYGTIVDDKTGKIMYENVYVTVANDQEIIQSPIENPYWHQQSCIVAAPLIEVDNSVWHIALADVGSKLNEAMIEMFNLMNDSAMNAVHGIKQLREDALADVSQISNGIHPGMTLRTNSMLAPGEKVIETVVTGNVPPEAVTMFNLLAQEFNTSMMTNDLRMGVQPFRQVKATEVVEASNSITSVFQGIAKNVESKMIQPELELAWKLTAQNINKIDVEELVALFGRQRAEEIKALDPEDVFAETVSGLKFEVYGLSMTLSKNADFRKLTTLLQTIGASEVMIEEFIKRYDFGKLLGEIMTALDINKKKIEIDKSQQQQAPMQQAPMPGGQPNQMSQVPQAGGGSLADIFGQPNFPGSPATAGMGGGQ